MTSRRMFRVLMLISVCSLTAFAASASLDTPPAATPPGTEAIAVSTASALASGGDHDAAARVVDGFLATHPESPVAQALLAQLKSFPDVRLERVEHLIDLEPYDLSNRVEQVRLLVAAGRFGEAVRTIEFIEQHGGSDIGGLPELKLRAEEGRRADLARAGERRQALLAANPHDLAALLDLAGVYATLGAWHDAEGLYEDYLEARPEDENARLQYARVLSSDQRWSDAEQQYLALLQQSPDRADLRLEYAEVLARDGQYNEALETFRSLTTSSSTDVPARAHRGMAGIYRTFGWSEHARSEESRAAGSDGAAPADVRSLASAGQPLPPATLGLRYRSLNDSDGFDLRRIEVEGARWSSRRTAVALDVGRSWLEQSNRQLSANIIAVTARRRVDDQLTVRARAGANFYDTGVGFRGILDLGAEWLPTLQSRVSASFDHYDLVDDVLTLRSLELSPAVADAISINDLRARYDITRGVWSALAEGSYGFLSDENRRGAMHGQAGYRFTTVPLVTIRLDARYLSYDERSARYWSPSSYHALSATVHAGQILSNGLIWSAEGTYGRSAESSAGANLGSIELEGAVPVTEALEVIGNFGYGRGGRIDASSADARDISTYWQRHFYVGVRLRRSDADADPLRGDLTLPAVGASSPLLPLPGAVR